ncbi:MAG: hypothetical protein MAG794_01337 [Gammaproteobacteria bacterium]|nr:hypothetical protein [Gammaproteobacteria bacterium]
MAMAITAIITGAGRSVRSPVWFVGRLMATRHERVAIWIELSYI